MNKLKKQKKLQKKLQLEQALLALEQQGKFHEHINPISTHLEFDFDKNYKFLPANFFTRTLTKIWRFVFSSIAGPILMSVNKTKVVGKKNLKSVKGKGAITVSNHIFMFDVVMISMSFYPRMVYFPMMEQTMKVPYLRHFLKSIGGMPIPSKLDAKKNFLKTVDKLLKKDIVHFMPEGSCWDEYQKIRPFLPGAFNLAVKNNVPIVPITLTAKKHTKERNLHKPAKATVFIGKPIYPNLDLPVKERMQALEIETHKVLTNTSQEYYKK